MALERNEVTKLRQFLVQHFNISELKDLAFDLGTDHQQFPHETIPDFSRELIGYFKRRDQLSCLVTEILKCRLDDKGFLTQLLAKLPPCSPPKDKNTKVQIHVHESLLPDVSPVLKRELATKLNLAVEEIAIVGMAFGSMRLLVSLPGERTGIQASYRIDIDETRHLDISIDLFDSLDQTSQKTWRLIACNHPPIFRDNMLRPTVHWQEALEAVRESQSTHSVNLPSQLTPSELLFYKELPQFIAELLQRSHSLRKDDKLPGAERCAQDVIKFSQQSNTHVGLAVALIYLADVHREMGKLESAMINYQKAYRIFQRQLPRYQRHNEAVSAYALGIAHQLSDRKSDALQWYQTSGQLFERVEKDWSLVNDLDQVKICIRIQNWIRALSGYLTDVQVHTSEGYIWIPIIPLDIEKEKQLTPSGSKIETLDGKSFRVQSLETEQRPSLESDIVYYALNIPYEASKSLNAVTGDYVLVEQQDIPEQEGPGVLQSVTGQDFGHFRFDDKGNVHFICMDTQMIGDKGISKSLRVGYITALLKPISTPPDPFASPPPSLLADSIELYSKLVNMVGGNEWKADHLIEHERELTPNASRLELIDSAIVRLTMGSFALPLADSTELYTQLVNMVNGNKGKADYLIEHERERTPSASRSELVERAIIRLTRDKW